MNSYSYSVLKAYTQCPYRLYRERVLRDVKGVQGEEAEIGERVHKGLETAIKTGVYNEETKKFTPVVELLRGCSHIEVEKELVVNKDLQPTTWWANNAWFRSKLDVLTISDDVAAVIDWKNGKRRPDFFQLRVFAWQTFLHYPQVETVKASLVWLKTQQTDVDTYHRHQYQTLQDEVLTRIERIETDETTGMWEMKPSGLCNYCCVKPSCPAHE